MQAARLTDKTVAVVHELRVRDVRLLINPETGLSAKPLADLLGEDFLTAEIFLKELVALPAGLTFSDITGDQLAELMAVWDSVNARFYKQTGVGRSAGNPGRNLDGACAALIGLGHVNVWDYGWGFFMTVVNSMRAK